MLMHKGWPKSLVVQISAVMLIGILSILMISTQIYFNERDRALNISSSGNTLSRLSALIGVLSNTPDSLHQGVIEASQGRGFILSVESAPLVLENKRPDLQAKLKRSLHARLNAEIEDIRIISVKVDKQRMIMRMHKQHSEMGNRMKREKLNKFERNIKLSGSILLSKNKWLNFSSVVDEKSLQIPLQTLLMILFATVLILASMVWVIKRALLPVKALAVSAERVGNERDFSKMPLKGPSEIIPTIVAFNTMQSQLSRFINDRTKMLAAISHDLRTPITSLRLRLEFIEAGQDKDQMLATISQMEAMIKATLNFAKEDAQQEGKQSIELVSLLETIIDDYQDQGANITLVSPDKLVFRLWPSAIRRVLENLINNSLRYGKDSEGNVSVAVECLQTKTHLVIKISDDGKGIEEGSLCEVMKPFVRLDKARDTSEASVGLGLAISQSIVQSHGGTLLLSNKKTGGLCVEISLPH